MFKFHRILSMMLGGVMLFLALSPFAYAADYPSFGPQTYENHKYYYFGDSTYDSGSRQGVSLDVDSSSISFQSVKATVTLDYNLVLDRKITKFVVLANGVNVDEFEPYFDNSKSPGEYLAYYYLDLNISTQYIGSDVFFQIVGLSGDINTDPTMKNVFVTAWSMQTPTYSFKPLPVYDRQAVDNLIYNNGLTTISNNLLQAILDKLNELKLSLEGKLDKIDASIRAIYEVQPETQAKFDLSLANLQAKLPTEQVKDQVTQVTDLMNESADRIANADNGLKFGSVTYMNVITVPLLDFTEMEDSVRKLRLFIEITIWISFFIFVIRILTPKLTA
jgi:hypothetical protein